MTIHNETVLILDFGSQYLQLIARRVRECGVYSKVLPHTIGADRIKELNPKGLILTGGPDSAWSESGSACDPEIFNLGIPVLGICYGMQIMAVTLGGQVGPAPGPEYGRAQLELTETGSGSKLFSETEKQQQVWMSHTDCLTKLPDGFECLATSPSSPISAIAHRDKPLYGLQFHPEVVHSIHGMTLFKNFLQGICGCRGDWTMKNFAPREIERVREKVGSGQVICALSGGVDSAVVAAILAKAIGKQLKCIFVDHGLLRKNEAQNVVDMVREHFDVEFKMIDASAGFLSRLEGVEDPQEKRKRIGHYFIDVFAEAAKEFGNAAFLAQGTIYPDIIESGMSLDNYGGKAPATIKLHHNVGGLPEKLGFELIEPLRELFKDEVRKLGLELGLPEDFVWRHPFPGPGLAVRCLGSVTREKLDRLREADAIVIEEIRAAGLYRDISQAFAVLLPVKSVGVMGDCRTYDDAVAVRCVKTDDFMTADWSSLPDDLLRRISTRIINEVQGVNRVVYDISSKPPATIEWE